MDSRPSCVVKFLYVSGYDHDCQDFELQSAIFEFNYGSLLLILQYRWDFLAFI